MMHTLQPSEKKNSESNVQIRDYVTKAKLHQAPGFSVSIIMGDYNQGLDPKLLLYNSNVMLDEGLERGFIHMLITGASSTIEA